MDYKLDTNWALIFTTDATVSKTEDAKKMYLFCFKNKILLSDFLKDSFVVICSRENCLELHPQIIQIFFNDYTAWD